MTTLTERLVTGLSTRWAGKKVGRRSLLAGAAVVGSALATHPVQYATRPLSAMATVCGDGAACNEGWSAFCCTITGANQCPPGSFVAGWWKADRSGFCCGSARYYIDCNASCGSGWKCHCASGTCDQRRVACNQFRYGQCHPEISCYGPVVCRVVTCTPPWHFDKACGTTSLTDNRTVSHSAPCLPGTCPSTLDKYWYDHGGPGGALGKSLSAERNGVSGSRYHNLANAIIYTLPHYPVQVLRGPMLTRYRAMNTANGYLGFPNGPVTTGAALSLVTFAKGIIYWSTGTGAHSIYGGFYTCWKQIDGRNSGLGLPITERESVAGGRLRMRFQHGAMYWSSTTGVHQISGPVYTRWLALGGDAKFGLPTANQSNAGGRQIGTFARGVIAYSAVTGARAVTGAILTRWRALGGATGTLGMPTGEQSTLSGSRAAQRFSKGAIFVTPQAGARALTGVFWAKWQSMGGTKAGMGYPVSEAVRHTTWYQVLMQDGSMYSGSTTGTHYVPTALYRAYQAGGGPNWLGLPTSDPRTWGTRTRIDFQKGSLAYDPATGKVVRI